MFERHHRQEAARIAAAREAEHQRQLAEDDLTSSQRAMKERAVESLERAFWAQKKCRRCGRHLSNELSKSRGVGPECWEKAS